VSSSWPVNPWPQMGHPYKPETRGPAVHGSAGLKRDMESMDSGGGWSSHVQARDRVSCSTRQCRVKRDMGSICIQATDEDLIQTRYGSAGLKGIWEVSFRAADELSYKPDTAVQG
jgi:hypothetical protein